MLPKLLEASATLLIVTILLLVSSPENGRTDTQKPSASPDSDGKVPIRKACYDEQPHQSWAHRQAYRNDAGDLTKMEVTIYVDMCELKDLGAGPQDIKSFIKHEKAHADGYIHFEGDPSVNAAYYPSVKITKR